MGIKQKLGALLSGGTGIGLLVEGGVDEGQAKNYINQYNSYYNTDWSNLYRIWEDILMVF